MRHPPPDDAARAVAAARAAFDAGPWPTTPVADRAALLHRIAELLARDREPLARIETTTPVRRSRRAGSTSTT
jgi:betaine-aldehyde dehydrogenase